jgi:uncharacterized protein (DUF1330 family)
MTKGYWIARIDVEDAEGYKAYIETARPAFEEYGARFIVRAGALEAVEGVARSRNVVIEFPSIEAARVCYTSPVYQRAKAIREKFARGELIIIEGFA